MEEMNRKADAVFMTETLFDGQTEQGVELDHVVFDKEVHITHGRKLIGQASYPLAIAKETKI